MPNVEPTDGSIQDDYNRARGLSRRVTPRSHYTLPDMEEDEAALGPMDEDRPNTELRTEAPSLIGREVTITVGVGDGEYVGVLLGQSDDRVMLLKDGGVLSAERVLANPTRRAMLTPHWSLAALGELLAQHPRARITTYRNVTGVRENVTRPRLRVMDGVYLMSGVGEGTGRFLPPPPPREQRADRSFLVMAVDETFITGWCPATGFRQHIMLSRCDLARTFQATRANWCTERVDAVEQVARYMRDEYERAMREDR